MTKANAVEHDFYTGHNQVVASWTGNDLKEAAEWLEEIAALDSSSEHTYFLQLEIESA